MAEKIWKVAERKVSAFFGTKRNILSGSDKRHTGSDTLSDKLFIEVKQSSRNFAVLSVWDKANAQAAVEHKTPVVALVQKGRVGFWLVVHCDDLESVAKIREVMQRRPDEKPARLEDL